MIVYQLVKEDIYIFEQYVKKEEVMYHNSLIMEEAVY